MPNLFVCTEASVVTEKDLEMIGVMRKGTAGRCIEALLSLADEGWVRGECKGTLSSGEGLAFTVRDALHKDEPLKERVSSSVSPQLHVHEFYL